MEPNEVLKSLRIERGITQNELSDGISTRNTLGSYESKGKSINYQILRQYLDRLNISVEEFDYLSSKDIENNKKELSTTLSKLYYHQEFDDLQRMIIELEDLYHSTNDFYYFHLVAQYTLSLDKEKVISINQSDYSYFSDKIKLYLSKIDSWGQFEASLFINFMHIFETEYVIHMLSYIWKKKNFYGTLYKKYRLLEKMYLNSLYLLYERNEIELLPIIIRSFKTIIDKDDLKSKVIISFFEGIIENDESKRNRTLQILRTFDMGSHADYLSSLCQ